MAADTLIILSPGFPADESDSTCLPAQQQLVRAMNRNFPSIKIIILAFQYPYSNKPYQWYGNEVIPFGGRNRKRLHRLWVWNSAWSTLRHLKKTYALQGLCCFWYGECALVGKLFAKKNRLRFFTWILGQDARAGNKYAKWMRANGDELVAISPAIVNEFEKNYAVKPEHIIPNAVTPSLFPAYNGDRDIDLMGVGSLIGLKRFDLFVEMVAEIKKQRPFVKAIICGEGRERLAIEKQIREKGLTENISLVGELPYPEVLLLMQRCRILLHPSSYEGFSGVCLEALYAGAHVISFCNPKNAWVRHWYIAQDAEEMVSIALDILADPSTVYRSVLPYHMDDSARAFMELFA